MIMLAGWDATVLAGVTTLAARSVSVACLAAVSIVAANCASGIYRRRRALCVLHELPVLAWAALVSYALVVAVVQALGLAAVDDGSVLWVVPGYGAAAAGGRAAGYPIIRAVRRRSQRHAIVVGTGPGGRALVSVLRRHREYGLDPLGMIATRTGRTGAYDGEAPVLGDLRVLPQVIRRHSVAAVIASAEEMSGHDAEDLLDACATVDCELLLAQPGLGLAGEAAAGTEYLGGIACAPAQIQPHGTMPWRVKRAFDLSVSLLALAFLWPVLAVCAVAVRLEGGPGVLFRQTRVGLHGRPFVLLKFRTLAPSSGHEADTLWSIAGDERIGPVGRFLRRTCLDELPQLWNVVRGEMSLVGPRPERPHFVEQFSATVPGYRLRHRVPAGLTGWSQVHGLRGDTSIEERARLDNHYIAAWSLWTDLKILLLTFSSLLVRARP
jgi:exopolysaccharide biosynthesis polyprenyl glycosylphosphotransferase